MLKIHKGGNELSLVWTMKKKQLSVCLHSTSHNEGKEERVVAAVQQMGSMAGVSPTFSHNCVHGCKPSIHNTALFFGSIFICQWKTDEIVNNSSSALWCMI